MGCGGSKEGENPDAIKYEMKDTKIPEFDELFKQAGEVLQSLEELRAAFQDTRDRLYEIGRCNELKDGNIKEAFRVFLWSVSAHKDGQIGDCVKLELDPIGLTTDCGDMDHVTNEFADNAKTLLGGVTSGPEKVLALIAQLTELSEKAADFPKTAKDSAKNAGLDFLGIAAAVGNTLTNIKTVLSGIPKAKNVVVQVKEGAADLSSVASSIVDMIKNADDVGKKAAEKKHLKIDEIFDHYQTAPKKTPQELEAEKKGKGKKNKKDKKDKKDGKKPEDKKKN